MACGWIVLLVISACLSVMEIPRSDAAEPEAAGFRIAFTSLRERPLYTVVYFYDHDGEKTGKIVGGVAEVDSRSDHHPALSSDGKRAVFAGEVVAKVSTIYQWDGEAKQSTTFPEITKTPNAQMAPALSGDGKLLAFEAWNRVGSPGRWDLLLFDVQKKSFVDAPNLNTTRDDERKPTLSEDGRWIAFTTNAKDGAGQTDVRLYDRQTARVLELPGLNSAYTDTEPAISGDGRYIAFVSNRPRTLQSLGAPVGRPQPPDGRAGTRDIYLFDREENELVALPGLNSPGHEQSPSITADGRYLAFVSERLDSEGERDIFVYDRQSEKLLPTPGLNSGMDEYDPCIVRMDVNLTADK